MTLIAYRIFAAALLMTTVACGSDLNPHQERGINTQGRQCVECHELDFNKTTAPAHVGLFATDCNRCHTQNAWTGLGVGFLHPWPLKGLHAVTPCVSCHGNPPNVKYAGTSQECVGCHMADFTRASTSVSGHSAFASTCQTCHNPAAWKPATPSP